MASKQKQAKTVPKTLKRLRSKHKAQAREVEAARQKLEKRSRKLQRLETKIAELEQRAWQANAGQAAAVSDNALRPCRLIFNPTAGLTHKRADLLEEMVACLRGHGIRPEVYLKTSSPIARERAREAVENKEALVIVAGGDGTIGDVAKQLVGSQTVLGILPIGTSNSLARELGIPLDLDHACALLGTNFTRQIDIGRVRADEPPEVEYFLGTAGLGRAVGISAGQAIRKRRWGKFLSALGKFLEVKPTPVEIELDDGEKLQANTQLVTISNAPLYGLNNLIAPEAKMDDGWLDIAIYDGMSGSELLNYFLKTTNGQRAHYPKVRFYRARRVHIRADQALPIISDKAEISERQTVDIEVVPQALTVIVGQGPSLILPVQAVASVPPLA